MVSSATSEVFGYGKHIDDVKIDFSAFPEKTNKQTKIEVDFMNKFALFDPTIGSGMVSNIGFDVGILKSVNGRQSNCKKTFWEHPAGRHADILARVQWRKWVN